LTRRNGSGLSTTLGSIQSGRHNHCIPCTSNLSSPSNSPSWILWLHGARSRAGSQEGAGPPHAKYNEKTVESCMAKIPRTIATLHALSSTYADEPPSVDMRTSHLTSANLHDAATTSQWAKMKTYNSRIDALIFATATSLRTLDQTDVCTARTSLPVETIHSNKDVVNPLPRLADA
jgi:hypothetical protein